MAGYFRVRVINDHVFHALTKVERRAEFKVFLLISFADDFNDGFGNIRDGKIGFARAAVEDGDVRVFNGAVRELDVQTCVMQTFAAAIDLI